MQSNPKTAPTINIGTIGALSRVEYVSYVPKSHTILNASGWLVDIGACVHICADKSLFVFYQAINEKHVTMGNGAASLVYGM